MKKGKILIFVLGLLMGGCLFYTEHSKAAVLTVKHSYKNIYTQKYQKQVDAKLDEELAEYHKDQNIEELADLLEVIHAAALAHGYTLEDLEQVRAEKATKRGGFEKRIMLKEVHED